MGRYLRAVWIFCWDDYNKNCFTVSTYFRNGGIDYRRLNRCTNINIWTHFKIERRSEMVSCRPRLRNIRNLRWMRTGNSPSLKKSFTISLLCAPAQEMPQIQRSYVLITTVSSTPPGSWKKVGTQFKKTILLSWNI